MAISGVKELLKSQLETSGKITPSTMRVLIEAIKEKKFEGLDCYFVEKGDTKELEKQIAALKEQFKDATEPHRCQLIVHNSSHYTAVDLEIQNGAIINSFILDAANDPKQARVMLALMMEGADEDHMYVASEGCIQHDKISCPLFSLDHMVQVAKVKNIYEELEKNKNLDGISPPVVNWMKLPPQLLWNVQSLKFANKYTEQNPEKASTVVAEGESFTSYIQKGKRIVEGKEQNRSIENNVFNKLQAIGREYLEKYSEDQLKEVLAGRPPPMAGTTQQIFKALNAVPTTANKVETPMPDKPKIQEAEKKETKEPEQELGDRVHETPKPGGR